MWPDEVSANFARTSWPRLGTGSAILDMKSSEFGSANKAVHIKETWSPRLATVVFIGFAKQALPCHATSQLA